MILSAFLALAAHAQPVAPVNDKPKQVVVFGVGHYSCERAWETEFKFSAFSWVMGYFSGRNVGDQTKVGGTTDGDGVVAEVRKVCDAKPSLTLATATERVFVSLSRQKR